MSNDIVIIAVHPDDETLGCGGTLLRHVENGDIIHWVIVTTMTSPMFTVERIKAREKEIENVSRLYGFKSVTQLGFPTTQLSEIPEKILIDAFSKTFRYIKPHTIYMPFKNDIHSDHRKSFDAAIACTKSFRYPFIKRILMMEVLSETEYAPALQSDIFLPNVYVNIEHYIDQKIKILSQYDGEVKPFPFPRSIDAIKALAQVRGVACNSTSAEAFMLLKEVI